MTVPQARLDAAKKLVDDVLAGRVTPATDPAVFDDDLLYIQVGMLEQLDADWLKGRLTDPAVAADARDRVVRCLSDPGSLAP